MDDEPSIWLLKNCLPRSYHPMTTDSDVLGSAADYIATLKKNIAKMTELSTSTDTNFLSLFMDEFFQAIYDDNSRPNTARDETPMEDLFMTELKESAFLGNFCSSIVANDPKSQCFKTPALSETVVSQNFTLTDLADLDFLIQPADSTVATNAPKRPGNGYIRFSCEVRPSVLSRFPKLDNKVVSKYIGQMWHKLDAEQKKKYSDGFVEEMAQLRETHPTWNYAGSRAKTNSASTADDSLILESRLRNRDVDRSVKPLIAEMKMPASKKSTQKKKTSLRQRKHDSRRSGGKTMEKQAPETEITNWVMCDRCHQWRKLKHPDDIQNVLETWYCYMNSDENHSKCFLDPEDIPSDEINEEISL